MTYREKRAVQRQHPDATVLVVGETVHGYLFSSVDYSRVRWSTMDLKEWERAEEWSQMLDCRVEVDNDE